MDQFMNTRGVRGRYPDAVSMKYPVPEIFLNDHAQRFVEVENSSYWKIRPQEKIGHIKVALLGLDERFRIDAGNRGRARAPPSDAEVLARRCVRRQLLYGSGLTA